MKHISIKNCPEHIANFIHRGNTLARGTENARGICSYALELQEAAPSAKIGEKNTNLTLKEHFNDVCHARLRLYNPNTRLLRVIDSQRENFRYTTPEQRKWMQFCLDEHDSPWSKLLPYTIAVHNDHTVHKSTPVALIFTKACVQKFPQSFILNFLIALRQTEENHQWIDNFYAWSTFAPEQPPKTHFLLALAYRAPQHKGQAEESLKIFGIPYSHFFVNGSKNGRDTFKLLNSQPDLKGHVPFALGNSKEEHGVNSIWNGYSIFNNDILDLERDELTPDPFFPAYPGFFGTYSLKPQLTLKEALTILEQEHFRQ